MSDNVQYRDAADESPFTGRVTETGQPLSVAVDGVLIESTSPAAEQEGLPLLSPGFFDLQVNGVNGIDYSSGTVTADEIHSVIRTLASAGVTRHLPTVITNSKERIARSLERMRSILDADPLLSAAIPGFHVEGPFISPEEGPRGAHDKEFVRLPEVAEYRRWQEVSGGRVHIVTLAPELPGALELIRAIREDGAVPAIGHSAASPEAVRAAVEAGAQLSTHLGNGSHATLPRLHNYLWEQLASDALTAGIISDGYHLPHSVLRVFARAKGAEKLILVSDVAPLAGMAPGVHRWGSIEVEVHPDGHLGLRGTEFLAGAGHLLDRCIPVFCEATGITLAEALRLCTSNPSRLLQMEEPRLEPGEPSSFTLFDPPGSDNRLRVRKTVLNGKVIFDGDEKA